MELPQVGQEDVRQLKEGVDRAHGGDHDTIFPHFEGVLADIDVVAMRDDLLHQQGDGDDAADDDVGQRPTDAPSQHRPGGAPARAKEVKGEDVLEALELVLALCQLLGRGLCRVGVRFARGTVVVGLVVVAFEPPARPQHAGRGAYGSHSRRALIEVKVDLVRLRLVNLKQRALVSANSPLPMESPHHLPRPPDAHQDELQEGK
mmetsp:Transcript_32524/g.95171  ORF Transcript_32524/g.95171 Transcript_32524/m.95171 type:complete len:204 (+) Transcript_32524:634-1245(+)